MEATMFDGFMSVLRTGLDASGSDVHLHISLLVNISKADGNDEMEFLCSVWPNRIEIQNLYMLRRNKIIPKTYMGPSFGYNILNHFSVVSYHSWIIFVLLLLQEFEVWFSDGG